MDDERRERQRYLALVEHAPVGVFEIDPRLDCRWVNARWCEMTGLSPDEAIGPGWVRALHPEDLPAVLREYKRALTAGDDFLHENRWLRPDGTERWGVSSGRFVRDDDRTPTGFIGIVTDVTRDRRERARLHALIEHASDVILMLDREGTITYMSAAAHAVLGYPQGDRIGTPALDLVHPDDCDRALESFLGTVESGGGIKEPLFVRVRHADGRWLPVEVMANNLVDDPAVGGIVLSVRDITDRERVDRLLAESQARYRQIVELADEGIWTIDDHAVTTFVNRRMAEMLGHRPEEMVGRSLFDFLDEELHPIVADGLERAHQGAREQHELRLRHRDGRDVWTRMSTSPITAQDGTYEGAIALVTDVTQQRAVEEALRYNEARLSALFEASSDIMAVLGLDGSWHASPAATRILGWPTGYDPEGGLLSLVHPDDVALASTAVEEVLDGRRAKHEPVTLRVLHRDGHYLWMECTAENRVDDPTVGGIVIIARDVTERRAAEDAKAAAEARFRAAFERAPIGIAIVGLDGRIIDANPAFAEMLRRTRDTIVGHDGLEFVHPDDRERAVAQGTARAAEGRKDRPDPLRMVRGDGSVCWVLSDSQTVTHQDGSRYVIALMADVTDRKELEDRLEHQAFHDPLTGLANRALLWATLDQAWDARRDGSYLAVLFIDLDDFKMVNDRLGHDAGDELLLLVARRLEQAVRAGDLIARFGGDEFVVVCEHLGSADEALAIAERVREHVARSYLLSAGPARIAASVGVALDAGQHTNIEDLLRQADRAAYLAKQSGRDRVELASRGRLPAPAYPSHSEARSSR